MDPELIENDLDELFGVKRTTYAVEDSPLEDYLEELRRWKPTNATKPQADSIRRKVVVSSSEYVPGQFVSGLPGEMVIVVVPSLNYDMDDLNKITGIVYYEERALFYLLQLRHPRKKIVFVSSVPVHRAVVNYYLSFLPVNELATASRRLLFLSPHDFSTEESLSYKVIRRSWMMSQIKEAVGLARASIISVNPCRAEDRLSEHLNVPLSSSPWSVRHWGTKVGSRRLFACAGFPHPQGSYDCLYNKQSVARSIYTMGKQNKWSFLKFIIKQNDGFAGEGNLVVAFAKPPRHIRDVLRTIENSSCHANYWDKILTMGAIVEQLLESPLGTVTSPSVQGYIHPHTKRLKIISTHEQVLSGHTYVGCQLSCREEYRKDMHRLGQSVGKLLVDKGCVGFFSIDALCILESSPSQSRWSTFALEINLRSGGTTHPYMTSKYLLGGKYSETDGCIAASNGAHRVYVASDNVQSNAYRDLMPEDLIQICRQHQLNFNPREGVGCVFHLFGSVSPHGKFGVTCISKSIPEAVTMFQTLLRIIDRECEKRNVFNRGLEVYDVCIDRGIAMD